MALRLSQSQKTSQKQIQKLSQIQIQSLKYLAMNSADLVNEIYNEIEKNPVLEISEEDFSKGIESLNESEKNICEIHRITMIIIKMIPFLLIVRKSLMLFKVL